MLARLEALLPDESTVHVSYLGHRDLCRAKILGRNYIFAAQIDQLIGEIYLAHPDA